MVNVKDTMHIIMERKIVPVRFYITDLTYESYLIFDARNEIGEIMFLDELRKEFGVFKGVNYDFLPEEPSYKERINCPPWYDWYRNEDRKLFKSLLRYVKNLNINESDEIEIDRFQFLLSDSMPILKYKPHPLFILESDFKKRLLEQVRKEMGGTEIEYFI